MAKNKNLSKTKWLLGIGLLLSAIMTTTLVHTPELCAQTSVPTIDGSTSDDSTSEQDQIKVAKALEQLLKSMEQEPFTYNTEGRPDPFMPFVSEEVVQDADLTEPERLTGMRQFEPGQLSLVAIVFTEKNPIAMVEDSAGKGYVIKRGTKIGRTGVVADIVPNQVIIKQLTASMTKKKTYNTVEMVLRKEGEKL